jgi:beta-phosphoglucomutase-like phosphatase (HAD superfamily)
MCKIKSIIFDLDDVLVDIKYIYFATFNKIFPKRNIRYQISIEDYSKIYDVLPTVDKFNFLSKNLELKIY